MFENLPGNISVKKSLQKLIESGEIPHAMLFAGPEETKKEYFAQEFANEILGIDKHRVAPDLLEYHPEGKMGMHSIESMRTLSIEVGLAPYSSKRKVFILYQAERMQVYSANSLLKTLEEPSSQSIIILISSHSKTILPTIISRCRIINFIKECSENSEEDLFELCLLDIFSRGGFSGFEEITMTAQSIAEKMNSLKKSKVEINPDISALQKQSIEKLHEGEMATEYLYHINKLFEKIAGWYRDLILTRYHASLENLYHKNQKENLKQAVQKGAIRDLNLVLDILKDATEAINRSSPIQSCLETVFLRLQ